MRSAAVLVLAFAITRGMVLHRKPAPAVATLHPCAQTVPANHLRFYVDFTEPMNGGDAFEHVRLLDGDGCRVQDAFREIELWSRGRTRLMLYVHPGRIKRGLALRSRLGPVLIEGRHYTLEILPGMLGGTGRAVERLFRRSFRVGPDDRRRPDVSRWRIKATPNSVVVESDEWVDHAGLETMVSIQGIEAAIVVQGRTVVFTPARPLAPGRHLLVVDPEMEDLAGNSFLRLFEREHGSRLAPAATAAFFSCNARPPAANPTPEKR